MLFLFASLPSTSTVPSKTISLCQRLCLEFEHYLITSNSLRKSFLSIKGIYYQATIQGQDILWLVPYKFVQRVTGDVDFRIMGTFVEFYTTLLGFVNFRLYTSIGLIYPPKFNAENDEQGGELSAFLLEGKGIESPNRPDMLENGEALAKANGGNEISKELQKRIDAIHEDSLPSADIELQQEKVEASQEKAETTDTIDTFLPTAQDADTLPQPSPSSTLASTLFTTLTFYLSRETPRAPLEFLLRAFGCKRVGWDAILGAGAFTTDEDDPRITHQIVDRPPLATLSPEHQHHDGNKEHESEDTAIRQRATGGRIQGRIYVQPQWVWDCVNEVRLLRPDLYAPGATLPPHLSPWVKPTRGAYDPTAPLSTQEKEGEAEAAALETAEQASDDESVDDGGKDDDEEEEKEEEEEGNNLNPEAEADNLGAMRVADSDSSADEAGSSSSSSSKIATAHAEEFSGFDSPQSPSSPSSLHQRELEAEALGLPPSSLPLKGILKRRGGGPPPQLSDTASIERTARERKKREEEEDIERRKMMLGRKKRKLVEKMLFSNREKEAVAEGLRRKRRRVESERK